MKSLFIAFEGIDGTGKSTQAKLLRDFLIRRNYPSMVVRHPSGEIRKLLLGKIGEPLTEKAQLLLFAADSANTYERVIEPALKRNVFVICDRYIYSNYAYRTTTDHIKEVYDIAVNGVEPDLVFLLDAPAKDLIRRQKGIDRYERASIGEQQERRHKYLSIMHKNPDRFYKFNALLNQHVIQEEIRQIVDRKLLEKNNKVE